MTICITQNVDIETGSSKTGDISIIRANWDLTVYHASLHGLGSDFLPHDVDAIQLMDILTGIKEDLEGKHYGSIILGEIYEALVRASLMGGITRIEQEF